MVVFHVSTFILQLHMGGVFIGDLIPTLLLVLKGGSWQQSGGLLQPTLLFRRKARSTMKKQTAFWVSVIFLKDLL